MLTHRVLVVVTGLVITAPVLLPLVMISALPADLLLLPALITVCAIRLGR